MPSVERLLGHEKLRGLELPRSVVLDAARSVLDKARGEIRAGGEAFDDDQLAEKAAQRAKEAARPSLDAAVNATGIILHTGLGRAVISAEAREQILRVAAGHSTLEIDRETGRRGSRLDHVGQLLCKLTGAEAAAVVNNNAAAVLLAINTLAGGRTDWGSERGSVVISRGQLVEIGGSFRIPDIIARAGADLIEVGTTNRTRISDYEAVVNPLTSLILRVHPSNFRVVGFTEEPELSELVELGHGMTVPVMDDLGSGALIDMKEHGLTDEPMVQASVQAGCDVVTFSGDKLLGGPQAGILVGREEVISECRANPLYRALRVDKLILAGLEATLRLYLDREKAVEAIPVLRFIRRKPEDITRQARRLARALRLAAPSWTVEAASGFSQVGGGSLPGQDLPTTLIAIKSPGISADDLGRLFRLNDTPIFGRIERDVFLLDPRTVSEPEGRIIVECARRLAAGQN